MIMEKKMETIVVYWSHIGIMEKKMETTTVCWGNIGIMEKRIETTMVYWGYIGIMENEMETTGCPWGERKSATGGQLPCWANDHETCLVVFDHMLLSLTKPAADKVVEDFL